MNITGTGIASLGCGFGLTAYAIIRWLRWRKVRSWFSVPGRVVKTSLKTGTLAMWPAQLTTYTPRIEYEYWFMGIRYVGTTISVDDRLLSSVDAERAKIIIDRIGPNPEIFIDTGSPASSCLLNRLTWPYVSHLLTYGLAGLLLLGIGTIFLLV